MTEIAKLLSNNDRLNMVVYAAQLKDVKYFRAADIINKKCLGENFNKIKEAKNMQAHFFRIIKAGIFVSNGKKGCYVFNREILKQYSQSINNIINE